MRERFFSLCLSLHDRGYRLEHRDAWLRCLHLAGLNDRRACISHLAVSRTFGHPREKVYVNFRVGLNGLFRSHAGREVHLSLVRRKECERGLIVYEPFSSFAWLSGARSRRLSVSATSTLSVCQPCPGAAPKAPVRCVPRRDRKLDRLIVEKGYEGQAWVNVERRAAKPLGSRGREESRRLRQELKRSNRRQRGAKIG